MKAWGSFASLVCAVGSLAAAPIWAAPGADPSVGKPLTPWTKGELDIHHIYTGRGNSAFLILPDGTTMLVDAGALPDNWADGHEPLKLAAPVPDGSKRPGEWLSDYISQFMPRDAKRIDYALMTHFHVDHFGAVRADSPRSAHGGWLLTGITDVAERWPVGTLIDRDYPRYDFPKPLRGNDDSSLQNYFRFVDAKGADGKMRTEGLAVGRTDQIRLLHAAKDYPTFSVRGIAANGVVWTGKRGQTRATLSPGTIIDPKGQFNENPLSCVIKISYGGFDYVTGGDLTGVNEPDQPAWFDIESKVAPVVGPVDVMTLNHHGNRDATNAAYLRTLRPRVLVEQTWVSDHPGGEVVQRMASRTLWAGPRDVFATFIAPETATAIGPVLTKNYKSLEGHVVVRVRPGGQSYDVFILDDRSRDRLVTAHFGPYKSQ